MNDRVLPADIRIRRMKTEDYDEALALWVSCDGLGICSAEDSRAGIDSFLRRNPKTCFVAETGQSVIGTIMAGNDGRRGYLYHVAVSGPYRHRGVGTALVERSMTALRNMGIRKTALVTYTDNDEGNAFWDNVGFSVREDLFYRNRRNRVRT